MFSLIVVFHDKMDLSFNCDTLSKAGGRALGSIINKVHGLKDFGFRSYEKLFDSCVTTILDNCASVWGYKTRNSITYRTGRCDTSLELIDLHQYSPL